MFSPALVFNLSTTTVPVEPFTLATGAVYVIAPLLPLKDETEVVLLGRAPTSFAVYVGFDTYLAQLGTVGSVSVNEVKYPASF